MGSDLDRTVFSWLMMPLQVKAGSSCNCQISCRKDVCLVHVDETDSKLVSAVVDRCTHHHDAMHLHCQSVQYAILPHSTGL